ncbi:septal ring lytic transglycosylase RlpA family protein [Chitinophaga deserti]|uniref:septal ring lytic transglycosylase RlpA family protein n=1 Tax=Chitinophaga deserti TaxID=2164099 RepID=UPI000D6D01DB|nr:septal ring lytic transglycosylase RlpA family protein [Chitinophaga deserti]
MIQRKHLPTLAVAALLCFSSCARQIAQSGKASFYADKFQGRKTANGETFRQGKMTAAHKTLPFGTKVKVTNLDNGKTVKVRINDRGPFVAGRIIDLSKKAAKKIGMVNSGVANVKIKYKKPKG